jgi:hypothetical protein
VFLYDLEHPRAFLERKLKRFEPELHQQGLYLLGEDRVEEALDCFEEDGSEDSLYILEVFKQMGQQERYQTKVWRRFLEPFKTTKVGAYLYVHYACRPDSGDPLAMRLLRVSADLGYAPSMGDLAFHFYDGGDGEDDYQFVLKWARKGGKRIFLQFFQFVFSLLNFSFRQEIERPNELVFDWKMLRVWLWGEQKSGNGERTL